MAFRVDIGNLRPAKFLPDGRVRVDATLTRTGVFVYPDGKGGVIREYRPTSEVFDQASMDSFSCVVVTDDHPPVMVDAANRSQYERGTVAGDVRQDGSHMVGSLIISSPDLVAKMRRGKLDVSNGYTCDLVMTPGVSPDGEVYDAVQTNIRGNHSAIVDHGRAGSARVRMDGVDVPYLIPAPSESPSGERPTPRNDGATMDLTAALAELAKTQKELGASNADAATQRARADKADAKKDALKIERDQEKARADKAEGERDAARADADKAKAQADKARKDADDGMQARVDARVALETAAHAALDAKDAPASFAGKTDREVKVAVIKATDGVELDDKKSDAYVDGRFDAAVEKSGRTDKAARKTDAQLGDARKKLDEKRRTEDAAGDPETIARKKMIADNAGAWKTPTGPNTATKEGN